MTRRVAVALAFVALLALGTAAAVPTQRVLVVEDAENGEPYLTAPVENGTTVALEYTHSVEKTRVYDGYTVRGDRLVMTRMEFESYGWGLPSGANVTRENGTLVYDPPGAYTRFTVAPGAVAGHRLHVGDRTYDLVALSDERSVTLHLTRRSALAAATDSLDT
ncbi:DUF1850 domain-containing protein [Haloarcula pellucida]|uniref:C4-dicarboxylate ABC transporter n=1 Tax=Haloarcula pellucida TaxID=1427151 RepID=A0A830GSS5_9EURY|nr:DUF1850 domain-containing protein [Halomicroarcula pellucida]MBX0349342.1 DUF1850 domain-containing protein [Halomicroarcula pellucida]GGO03415.1 C4-dicarboxylate ABC transporter [Halomicroarcula pellucida]